MFYLLFNLFILSIIKFKTISIENRFWIESPDPAPFHTNTHSEVHEVQELLQHLCHDGEVSFWQVFSHSSHIDLMERGEAQTLQSRTKIRRLLKDSQSSPDTGSPAAGRCTTPRCCPPCASLRAAELTGRRRHSLVSFQNIQPLVEVLWYLCSGPAARPPPPPSSSWLRPVCPSHRWRPTGSHRWFLATARSGPAPPWEVLWWDHQSAPLPGQRLAPAAGRAEDDGEPFSKLGPLYIRVSSTGSEFFWLTWNDFNSEEKGWFRRVLWGCLQKTV